MLHDIGAGGFEVFWILRGGSSSAETLPLEYMKEWMFRGPGICLPWNEGVKK